MSSSRALSHLVALLGTPRRQRFSNFKTLGPAGTNQLRRVPQPHSSSPRKGFVAARDDKRRGAHAQQHHQHGQEDQEEGRAAAAALDQRPRVPPKSRRLRLQNKGRRLRDSAMAAASSKRRSDLEPIHRRLSMKPPSINSSGTRSSTELDYKGTTSRTFRTRPYLS